MKIVIDTTEPLSDQDVAILSLILPEATDLAPAPAPAAKASKAAKPAKAPEPEAEDLVGGSDYTMADAVSLATKLVSAGQSARVKEALADAGAKRVSELSEDAIPAFIAALGD